MRKTAEWGKIICYVCLAAVLLSGCQSTQAQTRILSSGSNSSETSSAETTASEDAVIYDESVMYESNPIINDASVTIEEEKDKGNAVTITFKDHNPIKLKLVIPKTWTLKPMNDDIHRQGYSTVNIYMDGKEIGYIANDLMPEFSEEWKADNPSGWENNYQAIYSALMGGNHITWNNEYTVVKENEYGETATCKIYYDGKFIGQASEDDGILSYHKGVKKYIMIDLEDGVLSDEEVVALAKTVEILE